MKNKVILKIKAGSHLYGLNHASSDEDYLGVYLSTPEELLGLHKSETIEENVVSKLDNGRNSKEAVDCKYYELKKFCSLALNNNPTILEMFFAPKNCVLTLTSEGEELLKNVNLFLSRKVKRTFLGYAHSQKNKSQVKSENLKELTNAKTVLEDYKDNFSNMLYDVFLPKDNTLTFAQDYISISIRNKCNFTNIKNKDNSCKFKLTFENYPDYLQIADLKFTNQKLKDVYTKIEQRLFKASHRADGMLNHGLDYKFISHTLRLLYEGIELLETGSLNFPLEQKEELMKIKLGQISPLEVMQLIEAEEEKYEDLYKSSLLPQSPNFKKVNELVQNIYKDYLKEVL